MGKVRADRAIRRAAQDALLDGAVYTREHHRLSRLAATFEVGHTPDYETCQRCFPGHEATR